jgi:Elongation factor G C-terminus
MRREGFELMVGPPTVIDRVIDGVKCEPFEQVDVTVPNDYSSAVVDMLNKRKGEMLSMGPAEGTYLFSTFSFLLCFSFSPPVLLSLSFLSISSFSHLSFSFSSYQCFLALSL